LETGGASTNHATFAIRDVDEQQRCARRLQGPAGGRAALSRILPSSAVAVVCTAVRRPGLLVVIEERAKFRWQVKTCNAESTMRCPRRPHVVVFVESYRRCFAEAVRCCAGQDLIWPLEPCIASSRRAAAFSHTTHESLLRRRSRVWPGLTVSGSRSSFFFFFSFFLSFFFLFFRL
jgi:hypothetical protein